MKRILALATTCLVLVAGQACKTAGGAAVGAGVGQLAFDDPKQGAIVGGSVGAVMDIID